MTVLLILDGIEDAVHPFSFRTEKKDAFQQFSQSKRFRLSLYEIQIKHSLRVIKWWPGRSPLLKLLKP